MLIAPEQFELCSRADLFLCDRDANEDGRRDISTRRKRRAKCDSAY